MRSSCTAENLRSPSVAGANHSRGIAIDDDIDLNTDYAESDVMLGGRAGTGTNCNGSNNNGSEDRNSNNNSAPAVAPRYYIEYPTVCTFENFLFHIISI